MCQLTYRCHLIPTAWGIMLRWGEQSSPECLVRPPPPLHLKSPTLTLLCRDFPRDGRDPGAHVLPRLSVTIEQGHIPHVPQASVWGLPSHFFLWLVGGSQALMPSCRSIGLLQVCRGGASGWQPMSRFPTRPRGPEQTTELFLFFPHNLKRHSTSSSFGLNLANAFSRRMSQIMNPEARPPALSCITCVVEEQKLPFRLM